MLIDSFGRQHNYLRISLTDACNMRCSYCMPDKNYKNQLVSPEMMTAEEVYNIASVFVQNGINKIRLTGGEPLLRKEFPQIVKKLSKLPVSIHLSTNGLLLQKFFPLLLETNIASLNISLDALEASAFKEITGNGQWQKILNNISEAIQLNFTVKINLVLIKGLSEKYLDNFIEWTRFQKAEVRFIELMPFKDNKWEQTSVLSFSDAIEIIKQKYTLIKLPDEPHSTVKKYAVPGFAGNIGFITTVTQPFCDSCNRLRLSAKGKLRNCLFSKNETDLLSAHRQGQNLIPLIESCLQNKKKELGGLNLKTDKGASMIAIGG